MKISNGTFLVTGSNRGLGRALVEEALAQGARRVFAAARQAQAPHPDPRVSQLVLDVTNAEHIRAAAAQIDELDVLMNNAGVAFYDDLTSRAQIEEHLAVNLFGAFDLTLAVLPQLKSSRGAIVNVLSIAGIASLPIIPSYSISKAAALSMTQGLRALLTGDGVSVHAVLPGPLDTEMSRDFDVPKATPQSAARAIFDGLHKGVEDIFPDPMASLIAESWNQGPSKTMERQNALLVQPPLASAAQF